jgi:tellurite resistance protein TehA-like permease
MAWLEASALGHAMRSSGVWTYGVVNLIHILGVATLFGAVLMLDLKLLGLWPRAALATVATPAVPLAAVGFAVAVLSGACLITTNATEYVGNPFLLIKFPAIALGLANAIALHFFPPWRARQSRELSRRERRQLAVFGGLSLAAWLTAIAAGRMIGYW